MKTNECLRLGVDVNEINLTLDIISCLKFLNAYLCNTEELKKHITMDDNTLLGTKNALDMVSKYLLMSGLDIDIFLKSKIDVIYSSSNDSTNNSCKDAMFTFSSASNNTTTNTTTNKIFNKNDSFALKFNFDISLYDIIEDFIAVSNIVNSNL
jgi:hypothetical protein